MKEFVVVVAVVHDYAVDEIVFDIDYYFDK
jgi:hypothetical protein